MFNWFKSKIELKKSTDIMSSTHIKKGLKIGSEIIVPNNFQCLIFYKGKCFNTLTEGKYKMDNKIFAELINAQQKLKFKTKYVKLVCHYITLLNQKLVFKFKKQQFEVDFNIAEPIKFASLMLLHTYKVDNDYTLNMLISMFSELLLYIKGDYKKISPSSLESYGIAINSFAPINNKPSIFSKTPKSPINPNTEATQTDTNNQIRQDLSSNISDNSLKQTTENNNNNNNNTQTSSLAENKNTKLHICPNCNNSTKFNTTYCLRCGHKMQ